MRQTQTKNHAADLIVARGILSAEAIAEELRGRIAARLWKAAKPTPDLGNLLRIARQELEAFEPILAQNLLDSQLAAWILAADTVVGRLPAAAIRVLVSESDFFTDQRPLDVRRILFPPEAPRVIRWPAIERAAEALGELRVVTRYEFDQLADDLKAKAFTVARIDSDKTIEALRDKLGDLIREGPSLRRFKEATAEILTDTPLRPGHFETVYRTNLMSAYSDGQRSIESNPIVADAFPYRGYVAIHDARVRSEHLSLETLGLSGTNIYRSDDPFWDIFYPPFSYNCRCGTIPYSIADAARKGVVEAQEWVKTGERPPLESRLPFVPWRPDPSFVRRGRVFA